MKEIPISAKVRGYVKRVVYAAKKLTNQEQQHLRRVQKEKFNVCGNVLFPGSIMQDVMIVKRDKTAESN
ncbi:hypothetical protein MAR_009241 [Mya arenaria]|uniref:Uncharacterized protein n=1 Tax=Mya arenaria TaxID=6604 RepID=A0ABY7DY55_MYAAR|nr:hypothetical protein MAR_009241 [Mya arenaria]